MFFQEKYDNPGKILLRVSVSLYKCLLWVTTTAMLFARHHQNLIFLVAVLHQGFFLDTVFIFYSVGVSKTISSGILVNVGQRKKSRCQCLCLMSTGQA
jgi:hypothetical protein